MLLSCTAAAEFPDLKGYVVIPVKIIAAAVNPVIILFIYFTPFVSRNQFSR
jgi:hypothetical protein